MNTDNTGIVLDLHAQKGRAIRVSVQASQLLRDAYLASVRIAGEGYTRSKHKVIHERLEESIAMLEDLVKELRQ